MNQYRCETCEHMKTHTSKGGLPFEERCEVSGYPPRDKIFENKLACVGCASHSDFQSERDKVLDKFKDCIMRVDLLKKYFDIQMPVAKVE